MSSASTLETTQPFGIHSLDHFDMAVPDLDEAQRFFERFGLDVRRAGQGLELRAFGDEHVWADLIQGPRKKLLAVRFGAFERDLAALAERLADFRIDPKPGSNGVWARTPDGLTIEIAAVAKTSPDAKVSFQIAAPYTDERGCGPRSKAAQVRPRRLAHLAVFTADVPTALTFFTERLGLKLSDRSGDNVAFLHGPHGSDHHLIAIARSTGPGLHHSSWDVASLAEVGLGAMQMAAAGYDQGWGLGRHVLGSNYFHYVRDPWGSYAEYSADMDYIPQGVAWPAEDHPGEDSRYQWGPPTPGDFGRNHEIEAGA